MDHVGPADQGLEGRAGRGRLEVEGHATLAPLARGEDPLDVAHLVAGGRLHLDHVGAQVGQQHGAEGPGQEVPQIEHAEPLERRRAPSGRDAAPDGGRRRLAPLRPQHLVGVLAQ